MQPNLKVLIVEDRPEDAELMVMYLVKEGYQVDWTRVESEKAFLEALQSQMDLILSDWSLPQFSGMRALQIYQGLGLDLPFIIVSGGIGEEAAVAAMRQGADDYLLKDRLERLGQAVKNALEQKRLRDENRKSALALAASEAELRGLFTAMPDLVMVVDKEGVICKVAPSKFPFPINHQLIVGNHISEVFNPEQTHDLTQTMQEVLQKGQLKSIEIQVTKNQKTNWFEISISPLSSQETIWIARDVSERKVMIQQLTELLQQQTAIANLARELTDVRDEQSIYHLTYQTIKELTRTSYFSFSLLDIETKHLQPKYANLEGIEFNHHLLSFLELGYNQPDSIFQKVIQTRKPVILSDPEQIYFRKTLFEGSINQEMHSACCLPVLAEERVVGLIELQSPEKQAYQEEDIKWIKVISNQVGLSLQKIQLFTELQQRNAELSTLAVIDTAVLTRFEAQEIYSIILEQITNRMRADAAVLSLYQPQEGILKFVSQVGYRNPNLINQFVRLGEGLAGKAALTQHVFYCDLTVPGNINLLIEEFRAEEFKAYYGISMIAETRLIGVLELLFRAPYQADEKWLNFYEMLANQAAIALNMLQLNQNLQTAHQELLEAYDLTIQGWSQALDMRDKETEDHTQRVADLTIQMAKSLGLDGDELIDIRRGALLHDIGKLGIPDSILLKPGSLTAEEWQVMKQHPVLAYQLLKPIHYLEKALEIPYCHHEKWDGTGYPRGLKEDEIPLSARLFAVADVYDALTSDRPYRKAWSKEAALDYIQSQVVKHFDPQVVEIFIKMIKTEPIS